MLLLGASASTVALLMSGVHGAPLNAGVTPCSLLRDDMRERSASYLSGRSCGKYLSKGSGPARVNAAEKLYIEVLCQT